MSPCMLNVSCGCGRAAEIATVAVLSLTLQGCFQARCPRSELFFARTLAWASANFPRSLVVPATSSVTRAERGLVIEICAASCNITITCNIVLGFFSTNQAI